MEILVLQKMSNFASAKHWGIWKKEQKDCSLRLTAAR
jgi:hypothetical protein